MTGYGEVTERPKVPDSKSGVRHAYRGFESPPLRVWGRDRMRSVVTTANLGHELRIGHGLER